MDTGRGRTVTTPRTEVPEILSDRPGSYPYGVLTRRHPSIIEQVRAAYPYGPRQLAALGALHTEITTGTVQPLPPDGYRAADWNAWGAPYFGRPWIELPFLWAEGYFYTKLLTAVDFWGPQPWTGIDPFAPAKRAELESDTFAADLAALDRLPANASGPDRLPANASVPAPEELRELVLGALWGNRADLGFLMDAAPGVAGAGASHLVADETDRVVAALGQARRVCVLADNSGRELLADLVLVDRLLHTGSAATVELQVKPCPYFISDTTLADVLDLLRVLADGPVAARELAGRVDGWLRTGRLVLTAHWFSGLPFGYDRMPTDLSAHLAGFDLVISKGDLNYRRLVGDRHWPADTPFAATVDYFPAPLAALRTVKSDVVVGVSAEALSTVEAADPQWRSTGRYALVQARL